MYYLYMFNNEILYMLLYLFTGVDKILKICYNISWMKIKKDFYYGGKDKYDTRRTYKGTWTWYRWK